MCSAHLLVGAFEFGGGSSHPDGADPTAIGANAGRAAGIDRHRLPGVVTQVELDDLARARHKTAVHGGLGSRHTVLVGQPLAQRSTAQLLLAAAQQFTQGGVGLFDQAALVTDHQHVRHGGEHAEDELLALLKFSVLLLQFHLVVDQARVDLVHLLDHVQPGRFVHALQGHGGQRAGCAVFRHVSDLGSKKACRQGCRATGFAGAQAPSPCPASKARQSGGKTRSGAGGCPYQCTVQTMQGSKERTMCCTATGVFSLSRTGAPTRACSSAPGTPAASRGEKFQLVGATIW